MAKNKDVNRIAIIRIDKKSNLFNIKGLISNLNLNRIKLVPDYHSYEISV
jgi:hypothetical protein